MGGKALKDIFVERKSRADYFEIKDEALSKLNNLFPHVKAEDIVAYGDKESFGDADILIASSQLPSDWVEQVQNEFKPQLFVPNGSVYSFDFHALQIDFILVPDEAFDFARNYFSYNDLGNLMGRVAHKMGYKYGHLGLFAPLRDGDHQYAELLITSDSKKAMEFLGYDYERHQKGFKNIQEIFEYTITSPYIHRDIFLLDNRNAKSRMRDAKRPTYTQFLTWLESHPEADKYTWPTEPDDKRALKTDFLKKSATAFPDFHQRLLLANEKLQKDKEKRLFWNGEIVSSVSSLRGKDLAALMGACAKSEKFDAILQCKNEEGRNAFILEELSKISLSSHAFKK